MFAHIVPQLSYQSLIEAFHLTICLWVVRRGIISTYAKHLQHALVKYGRKLRSVI